MTFRPSPMPRLSCAGCAATLPRAAARRCPHCHHPIALTPRGAIPVAAPPARRSTVLPEGLKAALPAGLKAALQGGPIAAAPEAPEPTARRVPDTRRGQPA